ncbi:unnamed protein product [Rotaria sp. Silwood2]|nr:unnamed protein product [Rotaria sp. Silwood2]
MSTNLFGFVLPTSACVGKIRFRPSHAAHVSGRVSCDQYQDLILGIKNFNHLDGEERQCIAMKLVLVQFNDGTALVYQAAKDEPSIKISRLGPNDYFSAKSLLFNQANGASVKAHGSSTCVKMAQEDFESEVASVLIFVK